MREVCRLSGFHRVVVFVSTLQAQHCKNYGSLRASTLYCEAGMNLYRTLYIAQYKYVLFTTRDNCKRTQGCIFRLKCSHPELTKDHVLTSAYVKILRTVTRNAVNKSV